MFSSRSSLPYPTNPDTEDEAQDIQDAAQGLGVQVFVVKASKADDLDSAFTTLAQHEARAVVVGGDTFFTSRRSQISLSAARRSLPTIWVTRIEVEAGGLMSYGANIPNVYRQAGVYAGQILNRRHRRRCEFGATRRQRNRFVESNERYCRQAARTIA